MPASVDFWLPAPALRGYISGYHRYELTRAHCDDRFNDVFFPAWPNIRFTIDAEPWSVTLGRRTVDPVPEAAFFGPSSHAGYVSAGSGTLIGIGLTPAGWARLHGGDLSRFADRVVPLDQVFADFAAVHGELSGVTDPAAYFDALLLGRIACAPPASPAIDIILARLLDPAVAKVADLGAGLDLTPRQVARITRTCFGFTPKLLLRRARFLRALSSIRTIDRGLWTDAVREAGYWDGSHFLRDCHLFLDQPLGQFMKMERPINRMSMHRRDEVLGAPMQSLHDPDAG